MTASRGFCRNDARILGGISTATVVARFAVKPTSSILIPRKTVDRYGRETDVAGPPRPRVGIRAVPVGEAMVACVIADHYCAIAGKRTAVAVYAARIVGAPLSTGHIQRPSATAAPTSPKNPAHNECAHIARRDFPANVSDNARAISRHVVSRMT